MLYHHDDNDDGVGLPLALPPSTLWQLGFIGGDLSGMGRLGDSSMTWVGTVGSTDINDETDMDPVGPG